MGERGWFACSRGLGRREHTLYGPLLFLSIWLEAHIQQPLVLGWDSIECLILTQSSPVGVIQRKQTHAKASFVRLKGT